MRPLSRFIGSELRIGSGNRRGSWLIETLAVGIGLVEKLGFLMFGRKFGGFARVPKMVNFKFWWCNL